MVARDEHENTACALRSFRSFQKLRVTLVEIHLSLANLLPVIILAFEHEEIAIEPKDTTVPDVLKFVALLGIFEERKGTVVYLRLCGTVTVTFWFQWGTFFVSPKESSATSLL